MSRPCITSALRAVVLYAILGALSACGGCDKEPSSGGCDTGADCDNGGVCMAGSCTDCTAASECQTDYGAGATCASGSCTTCTEGSAGCVCAAAASCDGTLVCESGACRTAVLCVDSGCVANQRCRPPAGGADAECLGACEPGFQWNAAQDICETVPANCAVGDPQSILQDCTNDQRECLEDGSSAQCGDCLMGFVDEDTQCVALTSCSQLDCAARNRNCAIAESLPACTECVEGSIKENEICRDTLTCANLDCEATGDLCSDPGGSADAFCTGDCGSNTVPVYDGTGELSHCAVCLCDGTGETGSWETTASNQGNCVCNTAEGHFFGEGNFPKGRSCDGDGDGWLTESARPAIESGDALITRNARCRLRRATAYVENDPGRHSAPQRLATGLDVFDLYESDAIDDPAQLTLLYDPGAVRRLPSYGGVLMAANQLNSLTKACVDDQADFNRDGITDTQQTAASPTTPFTLTGAFVQLAYFAESHRGWFEAISETAPAGDTATTLVEGVYIIREKRRPFDAYAADGARSINRVPFEYDEVPDANAGPEPAYWSQCLRQKFPDSNPQKAGWDFWEYGAEGSFLGMTHHSQFRCGILPDAPRIIGTVNRAELFTGGGDSGPLQWNACSPVAGAGGYAQVVAPVGSAANPSDAEIACVAVHDTSATNIPPATAGWVLARYVNDAGVYQAGDYVDVGPGGGSIAGPYAGGCINECVGQLALPLANRCPGEDSLGQVCEDDETDFGEAICGCGPNFAGTECQRVCPAPDTVFERPVAEMMKAGSANRGYWICASTSVTAGGPLREGPDPAIGYTLTGTIPTTPPAVTPAEGLRSDGCNDAEDSTPCYALRPHFRSF